ncbi:response regulator [Propionivibrio sp.]|uniref:response regulator n=1 Tax=Propionivibrio sp. TaxID=2212460 RepID=UPI00262AE02B|nr:response regulator [Propionivibrio sp.]
MQSLRQKYLAQLEPRLAEIQAFLESCRNGYPDAGEVQTIRALMHKLSGSGATYGYAAISDAARDLDESLAASPPKPYEEYARNARYLLDVCENARHALLADKEDDLPSEAGNANAGKGLPVILCVDDDDAIRLMLPHLLHDEAEVLLANDGREALALIEQKEPDVVLLDNNMPNLGGIGLLSALKEKTFKKKMAVVMLTADKKNSEIVDAFKFGIVDYVIKPFDPIAFRGRILSLLTRIKRKILIADDDVTIRDLLGHKFQSLGYGVFLASDGEQAYATAAKELPDVIILDRLLPGGDGLSIFRKLRSDTRTKSIPVIFLTAKRREGDIIEALNQGAQDYIVKPFNLDEVVARCTRYMGVQVGLQK